MDICRKTPCLYFSLCLILILGLTVSFCSSQSGSSSEENPSNSKEFQQRWVNLQPVNIDIPADAGGTAVVTRNLYFIMDGSGSMRERTTKECGGDQVFRDKITGAQWAIKTFLNQVPNGVNLGLYIFDRAGKREVVPLGSDNRNEFINAIESIDASGGTPLALALRIGTEKLIQQYIKQLGYGEFRLVVVTDGKAEGIPEAALYAAKYGVPIYTIGLCVGMDHPLRKFSVSYRAADNFKDLSQGLQDTLAEIPSFDVTQFTNEQ